MMPALYIHIPFCSKKCLYCDFYSLPYSKDFASSYLRVILKQIDKLDQDISSIYIGGGTPSALSLETLDKLLKGLKRFIRKDMEFSIEVNPESVDKEKLKLFIDKGVNRISVGVQSFDDKKLKELGRIHDSEQAIKAIEFSKGAGFKNISIDMIFGNSGENLYAWQSDLEKAAACGVQHISSYSLSYEKDAPIFKMKEEGSIAPLDDEVMAEMYKYATAYLPEKGFQRYEVSNFAKPGFECKHNLNYWGNNPYIGIGPSAVSYMGGARAENVKDVKEYIDRFNKGMDPAISREELAPIQMARETASVKIRTKEGISYDWFKDKTGFGFLELEKDALEGLAEQGLIEYNKKSARLTDKGFLFSDTVSSAFL
ncbi:MAG: radical SAM family heme chaperone HemW [Candidatus Omnitrophota bacterium]|nr:radical SAM family heme chaperone HemW [Candidatus Omnitrophota bacterium]